METLQKIKNKTASVGIIGLGYVGLPLARAFCEREFRVLGFDIDDSKVKALNSKLNSYLKTLKKETA